MLHPTRGKLLVEVIQDEKLTQSGLILSFKEEIPHRGRILALGLPFIDKKGKEKPWGMTVGHIVHFKRQWFGGDKKQYQILKRDAIYAVECEGKVFGVADYVIICKEPDVMGGLIHVPSHFETEVAKETAQATVLSVGKECRLGLEESDVILYYKNEGLLVKMPNKDELWSLKARSIIGKVMP